MKLYEFGPFVIAALVDTELTQTDLTVAVWGDSGRGNPSLTKVLFPNLVSRGLIAMRKKGNAKLFTATKKGIDSLTVAA